MTQSFDVAIVGGGLIGASLATALQRCGMQVAMIEAGEPVQTDLAEAELDSRVIAIGHAAVRLMQFCNAWPLLDPARASAYTEMQVEAGAAGRLSFDSNHINADGFPDCLGYIVENQVLLAGLQSAAEACGVTRYYHTTVKEILEQDNHVRVVTNDAELSAKLLVAADGGASWVREHMGIGKQQLSFDQLGLVARIRVKQPREKTAWQRFMEQGPLALLPMSDGAYSIVWSMRSECAKQHMAMSAEEFEDKLATATQGKFGAVELLDEVRGFPLVSRRADRYFSGRVVLCGDAAHQIHPLAGQGANLGFKDVIALTDQLLAAKQSGKDFASPRHLRTYERARKADNIITDGLMRALHHMFAGRMHIAAPLFARGMGLFNALPSVKHWLVEQAVESEPVSDQLQVLGYSLNPDSGRT